MMIEKEERERIIRLVKREVVPAIGCTEPVCVSLCVARATEALGGLPSAIRVYLSANILKNAMGVGIPGTGMVGLPIAVALGALAGKSAYGLEVLKDVTPGDVERGRQYIAERRIRIALKDGIEEKLYVEVEVEDAAGHRAKAVIGGHHTHFVWVEADGKVLEDHRLPLVSTEEGEDCELNLRKVYDFSMEAPLEEIDFILESRRLNEAASQQALKGCYGHELGKTLSRPLGRGIMGDTIFSHILSSTSCACDARMAGAMIPVMSNSGSGNQGICATMPVVVFAEENHNTEEELVRALMLSHLTAIYIKQHLGALSALCGEAALSVLARARVAASVSFLAAAEASALPAVFIAASEAAALFAVSGEAAFFRPAGPVWRWPENPRGYPMATQVKALGHKGLRALMPSKTGPLATEMATQRDLLE